MTTRRPKGTGCIYQRPDSAVYWLKYSRYGKSYRESTRTTDKGKAQKMLKVRLSEITTGQFIGPRLKRSESRNWQRISFGNTASTGARA